VKCFKILIKENLALVAVFLLFSMSARVDKLGFAECNEYRLIFSPCGQLQDNCGTLPTGHYLTQYPSGCQRNTYQVPSFIRNYCDELPDDLFEVHTMCVLDPPLVLNCQLESNCSVFYFNKTITINGVPQQVIVYRCDGGFPLTIKSVVDKIKLIPHRCPS